MVAASNQPQVDLRPGAGQGICYRVWPLGLDVLYNEAGRRLIFIADKTSASQSIRARRVHGSRATLRS
ncbi:MAG TPA: hypothetical protein VL984_15135 [Acidimicrobiales bacterium]|nr:hypothetical protein [Acidimicrobiales bacterium]